MRNPKISHRIPRSWPKVAWGDGEELCQGLKAPVLVSYEDLCGFEVSRSTWRSHERLLEYSLVSGSIPIPMKVVNENGVGG
jgi:hypothetical protein